MSFHLREWFHRLLGMFRRRDSETEEELRRGGAGCLRAALRGRWTR